MDKDPAGEASWLHCSLEELSSSCPHDNLLDKSLFFFFYFHPFPVSLPHSTNSISWDQLTNKFVVLEFLSQGLILEKAKLTQRTSLFIFMLK